MSRFLYTSLLILLGKGTFAQQYFSNTTRNGSVASVFGGLAVENNPTFYLPGTFAEFNPNLTVRLLVSERKNQQIVNRYVSGRVAVYYYMYNIKKQDSFLYKRSHSNIISEAFSINI